MNELNFKLDQIPQITSKYALLTTGEYIALNHSLSLAKGYNLGDSTARCFPIVPTLAKVDIQYDEKGKETFSVLCVALIDIEAQEKYAELLTGIELIGSYTPANITVDELIADGLTKQQIDWELDHLRFFNNGLKVVWLESEAPSIDKEVICEELSEKGITVAIVDDEN